MDHAILRIASMGVSSAKQSSRAALRTFFRELESPCVKLFPSEAIVSSNEGMSKGGGTSAGTAMMNYARRVG